ncbi:MAG TPA: hypothetical protein VEH00_13335 [Steroidobacteraceae bacterium]|nr:hypothetical protein [Steroidobacteraceae bacterium]
MRAQAPWRAILCALLLCARATTALADGALLDPTRPHTAEALLESDLSGVHVQAILDRSGTRLAIVDGRLVRAGDRIGGIVIEEVTAHGVRYSRDGRGEFAALESPKIPVRRDTPVKRESP